jgi:hypothetical protein
VASLVLRPGPDVVVSPDGPGHGTSEAG